MINMTICIIGATLAAYMPVHSGLERVTVQTYTERCSGSESDVDLWKAREKPMLLFSFLHSLFLYSLQQAEAFIRRKPYV